MDQSGDARPPVRKARRKRRRQTDADAEEIRQRIERGEVTKLPPGWAAGVTPGRWAQGFDTESG